MRKIHIDEITSTIKTLCIDSNYNLSNDIKNAFKSFKRKEKCDLGVKILEELLDNSEIASKESMPICQDTGMAIVFIEMGQEVQVIGGSLEEAINNGVRKGYLEGYLRNSIVEDPIERINTGDNTPAVIHYSIVDGDKIRINFAPKGFGSENMSQIKMLKPSEGIEGVKKFVLDVVRDAGANPCPPIIVGIGIGGSFEKAAIISKKALLRPINEKNKKGFYSELEDELLEKINGLGIGPQGFGGYTTALGVNIEVFPTHIAGLPVAVNISCHATRHSECII